MSISDAALVAQGIAAVVGLGLVFWQLKRSNDLAKAANSNTLVEHAGAFNALLIENEDLATLWYSRGENVLDEGKKLRYRELLVQWFIFHENIFYQNKRGLLDNETYTAWDRDLKHTVKVHNREIILKIMGFLPRWFDLFPFPKLFINIFEPNLLDTYSSKATEQQVGVEVEAGFRKNI